MTIRTLKYTALTLGIMTGLAGHAFAQGAAQQDVYFYPAKSWATGMAPQGNMCGIGTEFNNGFVVQINGSQDKPFALNIDFRQDIFEPGKTYAVSVSVPGAQVQSFSTKATGPNSLGVDLNKATFGAMRDASVFDVGVEGNSFRFYLTGFAAALGSFQQCLQDAAAGAEPVPGQPTAVNEASAMEKKEAQKMAIAEIAPVDPKPAMQVIPYTPPASAPELTMQESRALQGPQGRKRMSEQLAEQIEQNPEIAGLKQGTDEAVVLRGQPIVEKKVESAAQPMPMSAPVKPADVTAQVLPSAKSSGKPADSKSGDRIDAKDVSPAKDAADEAMSEPVFIPESTESTTTDAKALAAKITEQKIDENIAPMKAASAAPAKEKIAFNSPRVEPKAPVLPQAGKTEGGMKPMDLSAPPAAQTKKVTTPEMVVRREVAKGDADFTKVGLETDAEDGGPFSSPRKADPDMIRKVTELEEMIRDLKRENAALNGELKDSLAESKHEKTSISSENWDLERATMRYNEAQREIKRLGQQLQQERAQRTVEKEELEAQLFDPQVTSQQQLARLAELEKKLAAAQETLMDQRLRYEERIKLLEQQKAGQ